MNVVVVGLGYGDEGKGAVTDALVRKMGAKLVVRFNGGAQAAHHVVCDDGRWHAFHQFGAGTFAGARTHLSRFMLVDPFLLQREARVLSQANVAHPWGRLSIDPRCVVTTPYQQAMNRIRELARGDDRHGSCGMGIGETVEDGLNNRPTLIVGETTHYRMTRDTLEAIRVEKRSAAIALGVRTGAYYELLCSQAASDGYARRYVDIAKLFQMRCDVDVLDTVDGDVVFEGAQGALLDQDCGFAPHTTWSKTTAQNALALCAEVGWTKPEVIGVIRSYATRHGAGPLPTEQRMRHLLEDDHNEENEWQGGMRVGAFDMAMLTYALTVNDGQVTSLALTHLDKVCDDWPVCVRYVDRTPVYRAVSRKDFPLLIEDTTHLPIWLTSVGQTAAEKEFFPQRTTVPV